MHHNSSNEALQLSKLYLDYDFRGACLSSNNQFHDKFFNEFIGKNEVTLEKIWIVDNYKITGIKENKIDTTYHVFVKYKNAIEIDPIFNIHRTNRFLIDSLTIKDFKVVSVNQFKVSRDSLFTHIIRLYPDSISKVDKIIKSIKSALRDS